MTPLATSNVLYDDIDDHAITTTTGTGSDFPNRTPLRRAQYVRVVDLVPNIDINKVKAEIVRIDRLEAEGRSSGRQQRSTESRQQREQPSSYSDALCKGEEGRDSGGRGNDKVSSSVSGSGFSEVKPSTGKVVPPSGGFNMCLLVGKIDLVVNKIRVDKSRVRLAEVEVGDESGTVSLRARDEQIDLLEDLSSTDGNGRAVVLRNCTLELFQGKHLRVAVTKWGKMRAYPDEVESTPRPPEGMDRSLNFSKVDLNRVMTEVATAATTGGGGMGRPSQRVSTRGQEYATVNSTMSGGHYHHHHNPYRYYQQDSDDAHTISSLSNMSIPQQHPGRQPPQTQQQHYPKGKRAGFSGGLPYTGLQPLTPGAPPSNPNVFSSLYGSGSASSGGSGSQHHQQQQQQVYGYDQPLPPLVLDAMAEGQRQPQQSPQHLQHLGQQGIITGRQGGYVDMQKQQQQMMMYQMHQQQQQYEQMQLYHHQQQLESHRQPTTTFQHSSPATSVVPQPPHYQGSYGGGDGNVVTDTRGSLSSLSPINYNNTSSDPRASVAQDVTQQQQQSTNFKGGETQLQQAGGDPMSAAPTDDQPQSQAQGVDFHNSGEYFSGLIAPQTPHQVQQQPPPITQHLYMPEAWSGIQPYEISTSPPMNPKAAAYDPSSQVPVSELTNHDVLFVR